MNAAFLICLVLCIGFGVYALYAHGHDRAAREDRAEYHLLHGPNDGCLECEGK